MMTLTTSQVIVFVRHDLLLLIKTRMTRYFCMERLPKLTGDSCTEGYISPYMVFFVGTEYGSSFLSSKWRILFKIKSFRKAVDNTNFLLRSRIST